MNLRNFLLKHLQILIGRVYKNYQGQVAIFVALIFQIIFIFFALMINVGLLVHHKINLQQSTDLAAYYGAMKQAEMLNVVAHVNFQIRQAYKLLTWRYRILGTFGLQNSQNEPGTPIEYPITPSAAGNGYVYNPKSKTVPCSNAKLYSTDIPFMCLNHFGFSDYNGAAAARTPGNDLETFCKANCEKFNGMKTTINQLQGIDRGGGGGYDTPISGAINTAIEKANQSIEDACRASGPTTLALLSKFYASYLQDTRNKMQFIRMMMANLSVEEKEQKDIEGKKVYDGVLATFKNNLTEANNSSMEKDGNVFDTLNSLSPTYGGDCHYDNVSYRQKATETSPAVALFSEINFDFINFFILKCTVEQRTNAKDFEAQSIYDLTSIPNLDGDLIKQVTEEAGPELASQIKNILEQNRSAITMGIEKNPWCGVYYGVKASSTPIIPFLPISKIKLHASAFAQPFGGSIGPRAFKDWAPDKNRSIGAGNTTQVDRLMPVQNMTAGEPITTLKDNVNILLNYSNYVGDTKGLSDPEVVAVYHDMLLNRSVAAATVPGPNVSSNKQREPMQGNRTKKPQIWPAYKEWSHLSILDLSNAQYDPLARSTSGQNAFMRDIELSVVAPNQFEATYYSIEPDFYNVYVKGKLESSKGSLQSQVGITSRIEVPKDFGNTTTGGNSAVGGTPANFGVRNQLAVVQHVMRNASPSGLPAATTYNFTGSGVHADGITALSSVYFKYIPFLPGTLLTSWTMKDMITDDYSAVTQEDTTMPFGKCLDEGVHGDDGYGSMAGQADPRGGSDPLPPAPGNCVSGGRTGYSVKLVSPGSLFGSSVGPLRNQPTGFVSF